MSPWLAVILLVLLVACSAATPPPANTPAVIVFLGDSITAQWPAQELPAGAVNAGVHSNTTEQMMVRFQADVLARNPRIVVILGGINDLYYGQSSGVVDLEAMALTARDAGIRVLIGTLTPTTLDLPVDAFNVELRSMAEREGLQLVDYHAAMTLPDGAQNLDLFLPDGLHPNEAGYAVMRPVLDAALAS